MDHECNLLSHKQTLSVLTRLKEAMIILGNDN